MHLGFDQEAGGVDGNRATRGIKPGHDIAGAADRSATLRGVVIVSPGGMVGGGGIGSVTRSIKAWFNHNHPDMRVDVINSRSDGSVYWSLFQIVAAIFKLIWLRLRYRPQILHLQVSENLSFARKGLLLALGKALGMRVVVHHHGAELMPFFERASSRVKALVRWVVNRADVNIVLGEVWHRFLTNDIGVPAERVIVRFNAAHDLETEGPRRNIDPWHFLMSANLSPRKGIGELLQAVKLLADSGAPVRLTIAGGGQVDRYSKEAELLGISGRCEFTGWRKGKDMHDLFLSRSALVLPSYNEGLPMAIIEALSARLPVIATPVGSIPELLREGRDCLLVEPGKPDQIAAAMRRLATDADLCRMLADQGRLIYDRHFEVGAYMQRMLAVYVRLLTGDRHQA